jgi:HKD family nuclease
VRVSFVAQPYDDQSSLKEFLEQVCADTRYKALTCVVAWAKRSGLAVVADDLRDFSTRGESILLVGISQGGATRQGLELAIELFKTVYVVHDAGVTFHPKVYLAQGSEAARLFVGSMNLTAGGLQANYEAALDVDLDLRDGEDRELLEEIRAYVKRLIEDKGIVRPLDAALIEELASTPAFQIRDEDAAQPEQEPDEAAAAPGVAEAAADYGDLPEAKPAPFGKSREKKRGFPRAPKEPATTTAIPNAGATGTSRTRATGTSAAGAPPTGTSATGAPAPGTAPTVTRRWTKVLPPDNAQHPRNTGTNVTGSLRLTKAGHPIDFRTWFRRSLFGSMPWGPNPDRAGEALDVEFVVSLPGQSDKTVRLRVAHDPARESGQNNFATTIHWGDLMPDLRATDYTGQVVTIERYSDDTFRLTIAPTPVGPLVA